LNVILAIAVTSFPHYARIVRGQVLAVRVYDYILAVRSVGARDGRIMLRHILPNVISPVLVQASLGIGFAIMAEASLSFLGFNLLGDGVREGLDPHLRHVR
jgi:peptide/nickel transport system permease protein